MKNAGKKSSTIKIILARLGEDGYHLFLNIYIHGKKCRFLIDTGASKSVIDKGYFEKYLGKEKLKSVNQETTGLHSSITQSHFGTINDIRIGHSKISGYVFAAIDLSHVNSTYLKLKRPKIQGILGSDLMLAYKMIVDYGKLKIFLP